jgi:PKHD-type hydroxylase
MSSHSHAFTLPYVALPGAFSLQELDTIEKLGDGLADGKATIAERPPEDQYADIRVTKTAWMLQNDTTQWLYERVTGLVQTFNARFYEFELTGFSDPFQYTVYQSREGGHYDWHVDQGVTAPRKLSLTLQLSDPASYEGCDLQMYISNRIDTAPRERGTLIAFPSWVLHRVTPIVSGTRKSMVVWAAGPKFR